MITKQDLIAWKRQLEVQLRWINDQLNTWDEPNADSLPGPPPPSSASSVPQPEPPPNSPTAPPIEPPLPEPEAHTPQAPLKAGCIVITVLLIVGFLLLFFWGLPTLLYD